MSLELLSELIAKTQQYVKCTNESTYSKGVLLIFGWIRKKPSLQKLQIPIDIISLCANFHGLYFIESDILTTMEQRLNLFTLLSTKLTTKNLSHSKLLYKGSRDGYTTKPFLSKLTNNAPYLFIIKSDWGHIFGGYTTVDTLLVKDKFTGRGKSINSKDEAAFLFVLESIHLKEQKEAYVPVKPKIYPVAPNKVAIGYGNPSDDWKGKDGDGDWLFYFGLSIAIAIRIRCNENPCNRCCFSTAFNQLPPMNEIVGGTSEMDEQYFTVTDLEVYHV